jgi:antitoxin VapB
MARSTAPARTLNLKNPEVYRLAQELSAATGESMTEAVRASLQERLDRINGAREAEIERRIRRMSELAEMIRERIPEGITREALDDLMYDEHGLPKL